MPGPRSNRRPTCLRDEQRGSAPFPEGLIDVEVSSTEVGDYFSVEVEVKPRMTTEEQHLHKKLESFQILIYTLSPLITLVS